MKKEILKHLLLDCMFIGIIVCLSMVGYIRDLGFYSDDWDYLARFTLSSDQSISGLYRSIYTPHTQMRPVHLFYFSILYWLFGMNPLGYHLINAAVLISIAILFYLVLRRISFPRIIAVTIPLVYILLPHYSTTRFWFASFQINLSILFYFFSLYAGLKYFSSAKAWIGWWAVMSLVSAILSTLSYEVVIPLFGFNIFLFWNPTIFAENAKKLQKRQLLFIVSTICIIIGVGIFKAFMTTRLENNPFQGGAGSYIYYFGSIVISVLRINYGTLGIMFPVIIGRILVHYFQPFMLVGGVSVGALTFWYLSRISIPSLPSFPSRPFYRTLMMGGVLVCILGYAIFFINNNIDFFETGIGNRVAMAGAIGVALSFVGVVGWMSTFIPAKVSKHFFNVLIAVICAGNFLILNTTASFWTQAYQQEQEILADIRTHVPDLPSNSTLILDGICPYNGPAIVFESSWDLKGALHLMYHDMSLSAEIVKPTLIVTKEGVMSNIYDQGMRYPYEKLFIYNTETDKLYPISDRQTALSYFKASNPDYNNNTKPLSKVN